LTAAAESESSKSKEYADKVYKDNKNVIDFSDKFHPLSNKESMSIGQINESKRKKRVSFHAGNAKKLQEVIDNINNGNLSVHKMQSELSRFESMANSKMQ